jgi:hypothetical protein
MVEDRGKLLIVRAAGLATAFAGARRIARHVGDESLWRTMYQAEVRRQLGLFMLGQRLAGYTNIIDSRITAKIEPEAA